MIGGAGDPGIQHSRPVAVNRKHKPFAAEYWLKSVAFVLRRPFAFHFEHTLPLKRADHANVTFDRLDVLVD